MKIKKRVKKRLAVIWILISLINNMAAPLWVSAQDNQASQSGQISATPAPTPLPEITTAPAIGPTLKPDLQEETTLSSVLMPVEEIPPIRSKPFLSKRNWQSNEEPQLELADYSVEEIVTEIYYRDQKTDFLKDTEEQGKIKIVPQISFQPGKYTIKVLSNITKEIITEQDFFWGVLAINTNKSVFLPEEKAYLQMAALDGDGHTLCDAKLRLEILNPKFEIRNMSTEDGTIKYSDTCGADNVTDNPDYFAYFQTKEIGVYKMKLTNIDNGFEIEDAFEVKNSVAFDVERVSATRINPFKADYKMTIKVRANQDFLGEVVETAPETFEILNPKFEILNKSEIQNSNEQNPSALLEASNLAIQPSNHSTILSWNVNWKAGESYELSYEYKAPEISPQFYLLGPLIIKEIKDNKLKIINTEQKEKIEADEENYQMVFQEARSWQVAADAGAVTFRGYAVSNSTTATTSFTITIPATVATGDDMYVLAVSRDHASGTTKYTCTDNDSGGNTWTEKAISSDRKTTLFWKKATSATASKTITLSGGVGSFTGGLSVFYGGALGDPTTNIVMEENASRDESHAGFTPDNADSFVMFGVTNDANDNAVTSLTAATLGSLEPEQWEILNTGGADCAAILTGKAQVGATAATGTISWAQSNGTSDSISFAIKPYVNYSPTVVLDSPGDTSYITDTAPDLVFTGTDADSDDIEYNLQVDTVNTFDSQTQSNQTVDYNTTANYLASLYEGAPFGGTLISQSFTAVTSTLKSAIFKMSKASGDSPTGNIYAKIFAHSGEYGTSSLPTGSALATSDAVDASTLPTSGNASDITFSFSGAEQITLNNGQNYCVVLEHLNGTSSDYVVVYRESPSVHSGNQGYYLSDSWYATSGYDLYFYIKGDIGNPLISAFSEIPNDGFYRVGDTHPFTSAQAVTYTVQSALDPGTYYWRVKGIDPSGNNEYGDWSSTQSFEVSLDHGTANPFQRKTWYDGTRYWESYNANGQIEFWYSDIGTTWTENTGARIAVDTNDFSIEADSSNAFIAYTNGYDIEARQTNVGVGFTWSDATTVYDGTAADDAYYYPTISRDANNKVWINATFYGISASPYLYTLENNQYKFLSDFIGEANSKEKEYESTNDISQTQIKDGKIKLKITEELDETVYLNRIYLQADNNQITELSSIYTDTYCPVFSLLSGSDDKYLVMEKGDEYFLEFPAPEKYSKLEFVAQGYFIKEEKKPDFVKGENTNTNWVEKFAYDNPEYQNMPVVLREQNSIHFKKPDGKIEAQFASKPIHYQDENGNWQEIDTTIVPSTDPNYDFMNITNNSKIWFNQNIPERNNDIKIEKANASIVIQTVFSLTIKDRDKEGNEIIQTQKSRNDLSPQIGVISENTINYNNIYQNNGKQIDVSYTVLDYKLQEQIILNQYQGFPEISQEIKLTNAYAKEQNGEIIIFHSNTNELLWILPQPNMYEQNNPENTNFGLHYDLKGTDNNFILTKVFDQAGKDWLADPNRNYPVIIDPDYLDQTNDGYVYSGYDVNYNNALQTATGLNNTAVNLVIGQRFDIGDVYRNYRSFLKFDTSAVPDNASITQVNLSLSAHDDNSVASDFDIQIVKQDWSTQDPLSTDNMDTVFDGCLGGTADDSIWRNTSGMSVNVGYTSGNLSTSWPSKTGNTYYSLRSSRDYSNTTPIGFEFFSVHSQEDATVGYRPVLTITYDAGLVYTIKSNQSTSANDISSWGTQSQLNWTTDSNTYSSIVPVGVGASANMYSVWIGGTAAIQGKLYVGVGTTGWAGSADSIGTGMTGMANSISLVGGTGSIGANLIYIGTGGSAVYRQYTTSWQTPVVLDTNSGNEYPSISLDKAGSNGLYAFWIRDDDIFYKRACSPYSTWGDIQTLEDTGTNNWLTTGYSDFGSGKIFGSWTSGASSPYSVSWDSITPTTCAAGGNQAPNDPTSLAQMKLDYLIIDAGTWVNTSSISIGATATDPDASDTLYLCVENKSLGVGFSNVEDNCGVGVSYSGTAVGVGVTMSGLADGQYHWQVKVKDAAGVGSSWVAFGIGTTMDFGVDTSAPTGGTVYDGLDPGVDKTYNDGSLSQLSANWSGIDADVSGLNYYEYSIGTGIGETDVKEWTNIGTGTSATANSLTLQTSILYYFNVRGRDNAGNIQTAVSSNGQVIAPSLTFSVSPSTLSFDSLNTVNSFTDTKQATLTTSTNAYGGYIIKTFASDFLRSTGVGYTIPDFDGGTYASPAEWGGGNIGFGYTSSDTTIQGENKFSGATLYAPVSQLGPGDIVADHTDNVTGSPISAEQYTITYKVKTDGIQPAANYTSTIIYTATAIY